MPSVFAVLTHLGCVGLGIITGFALSSRGRIAVVEREDTVPWRTKQGRRLLYAVGSLVIGLLLIGFALQQRAYQQNRADDDARDAAQAECLQKWANDVTGTLQTRTAATSDVEKAEDALGAAERRQDRTIARVVLIVAGLRQDPPAATFDELDGVLNRFPGIVADVKAAEVMLDAEKETAETTKAENPYKPPVLACSSRDDD